LRLIPGPKPGKLFTLNANGEEELDLRSLQADIEKEAVLWALKKAQGDQGKAAELLKMPRTTFIYRLRQMSGAKSATPSRGPDPA
jgi:DNA-binding NtrC family response regulator